MQASTARYIRALTVIEDKITHLQRSILIEHWSFPGHAATEAQLAHATGLPGNQAVKPSYGNLAKRLRQEMDYPRRGKEAYLDAIVRLERPKDGGHGILHMLPEMAAALEELGWVKTAASRR
jgi:hypothetical protein